MKFGADRKKMAVLGGLVLVGAYVFYTNVLSSGPKEDDRRPVRPVAAPLPAIPPVRQVQTRRAATGRGNIHEFRPPYRSRKPEERIIDPNTIDPTLRTDLLAKVQAVSLEGTGRNFFQFGAAPATQASQGPKIPVKTAKQIREEMAKVQPSGPPPPPAPPVINLKYFGYSSLRGAARKRAFFLEGDDIFVAEEGELIKKRYKVLHIGINSVEVEDTQFQSRQTLPLQQEAAG